MFAELGLLMSGLVFVLGTCLLFIPKGTGLKVVGAVLTLLGAVTLGLQLWIYYRRWHNY